MEPEDTRTESAAHKEMRVRNLLPVVLTIFGILFAQQGRTQAADTLSIVDIRRNIPLADDEPVYKDFYLAGTALGSLKKNLVVTVYRKLTIRDSNGAQSYGDIEVPVGHLRIMAVFGRVAVAREYQLLSRDEHPMLEQIGIMSGDQIDLKGSFLDTKPRPAKRAAIETPAEATTTEQTAAVAPSAAPTAVAAPLQTLTPATEAGRTPATPIEPQAQLNPTASPLVGSTASAGPAPVQ